MTKDSELDTSTFTVIDSIIVEDGKLRVGIRNLGEMGGRWAGADNFQLILLDGLDDIDVDALKHRNDSLLYDLMPKIEGAAPDSSGFVARDATRFIVNDECNRSTSYGWTTKNIDYDSGNPYNDKSSAPYWNIWKGSAFSSEMSQDIKGLPTGSYVLCVLVRGSTNTTVSLTATSGEDIQTAAAKGQGSEAVSDSGYPSGWFEIKTDTVAVERGGVLTLKLNADLPESGWWSADHFKLTLTNIPHPEPEPVAYLTGDVNHDGVVDISDVVATINTMAKTEEYEDADVNRDQSVDISDIVMIINIIAGQ